MEEIEYLDEYKDLVVPEADSSKSKGAPNATLNLHSSRRISSDSSDSSIDADLFQKLFERKLIGDDQSESPSKSSSDSNDALEALFNIATDDKRQRDRYDSLDSIDDLSAALMLTTQTVSSKNGNKTNASKSGLGTSKSKTNKRDTVRPPLSTPGSKLKEANGGSSKSQDSKPDSAFKSVIDKTDASVNPIKKRETIVKPKPIDINTDDKKPRQDPLNLIDFLGEDDSDSSLDYRSDFMDASEDEDDEDGGEAVIDISTDTSGTMSVADDVTPVVSEDEHKDHGDNDILQQYLNNLDKAEPVPFSSPKDSNLTIPYLNKKFGSDKITKCFSSDMNASPLQQNDDDSMAAQVDESFDLPGSSKSGKIQIAKSPLKSDTVKSSYDVVEPPTYDGKLTYEKLERMSLDTAEQIKDLYAELPSRCKCDVNVPKRKRGRPRKYPKTTKENETAAAAAQMEKIVLQDLNAATTIETIEANNTREHFNNIQIDEIDALVNKETLPPLSVENVQLEIENPEPEVAIPDTHKEQYKDIELEINSLADNMSTIVLPSANEDNNIQESLSLLQEEQKESINDEVLSNGINFLLQNSIALEPNVIEDSTAQNTRFESDSNSAVEELHSIEKELGISNFSTKITEAEVILPTDQSNTTLDTRIEEEPNSLTTELNQFKEITEPLGFESPAVESNETNLICNQAVNEEQSKENSLPILRKKEEITEMESLTQLVKDLTTGQSEEISSVDMNILKDNCQENQTENITITTNQEKEMECEVRLEHKQITATVKLDSLQVNRNEENESKTDYIENKDCAKLLDNVEQSEDLKSKEEPCGSIESSELSPVLQTTQEMKTLNEHCQIGSSIKSETPTRLRSNRVSKLATKITTPSISNRKLKEIIEINLTSSTADVEKSDKPTSTRYAKKQNLSKAQQFCDLKTSSKPVGSSALSKEIPSEIENSDSLETRVVQLQNTVGEDVESNLAICKEIEDEPNNISSPNVYIESENKDVASPQLIREQRTPNRLSKKQKISKTKRRTFKSSPKPDSTVSTPSEINSEDVTESQLPQFQNKLEENIESNLTNYMETKEESSTIQPENSNSSLNQTGLQIEFASAETATATESSKIKKTPKTPNRRVKKSSSKTDLSSKVHDSAIPERQVLPSPKVKEENDISNFTIPKEKEETEDKISLETNPIDTENNDLHTNAASAEPKTQSKTSSEPSKKQKLSTTKRRNLKSTSKLNSPAVTPSELENLESQLKLLLEDNVESDLETCKESANESDIIQPENFNNSALQADELINVPGAEPKSPSETSKTQTPLQTTNRHRRKSSPKPHSSNTDIFESNVLQSQVAEENLQTNLTICKDVSEDVPDKISPQNLHSQIDENDANDTSAASVEPKIRSSISNKSSQKKNASKTKRCRLKSSSKPESSAGAPSEIENVGTSEIQLSPLQNTLEDNVELNLMNIDSTESKISNEVSKEKQKPSKTPPNRLGTRSAKSDSAKDIENSSTTEGHNLSEESIVPSLMICEKPEETTDAIQPENSPNVQINPVSTEPKVEPKTSTEITKKIKPPKTPSRRGLKSSSKPNILNDIDSSNISEIQLSPNQNATEDNLESNLDRTILDSNPTDNMFIKANVASAQPNVDSKTKNETVQKPKSSKAPRRGRRSSSQTQPSNEIEELNTSESVSLMSHSQVAVKNIESNLTTCKEIDNMADKITEQNDAIQTHSVQNIAVPEPRIESKTTSESISNDDDKRITRAQKELEPEQKDLMEYVLENDDILKETLAQSQEEKEAMPSIRTTRNTNKDSSNFQNKDVLREEKTSVTLTITESKIDLVTMETKESDQILNQSGNSTLIVAPDVPNAISSNPILRLCRKVRVKIKNLRNDNSFNKVATTEISSECIENVANQQNHQVHLESEENKNIEIVRNSPAEKQVVASTRPHSSEKEENIPPVNVEDSLHHNDNEQLNCNLSNLSRENFVGTTGVTTNVQEESDDDKSTKRLVRKREAEDSQLDVAKRLASLGIRPSPGKLGKGTPSGTNNRQMQQRKSSPVVRGKLGDQLQPATKRLKLTSNVSTPLPQSKYAEVADKSMQPPNTVVTKTKDTMNQLKTRTSLNKSIPKELSKEPKARTAQTPEVKIGLNVAKEPVSRKSASALNDKLKRTSVNSGNSGKLVNSTVNQAMAEVMSKKSLAPVHSKKNRSSTETQTQPENIPVPAKKSIHQMAPVKSTELSNLLSPIAMPVKAVEPPNKGGQKAQDKNSKPYINVKPNANPLNKKTSGVTKQIEVNSSIRKSLEVPPKTLVAVDTRSELNKSVTQKLDKSTVAVPRASSIQNLSRKSTTPLPQSNKRPHRSTPNLLEGNAKTVRQIEFSGVQKQTDIAMTSGRKSLDESMRGKRVRRQVDTKIVPNTGSSTNERKTDDNSGKAKTLLSAANKSTSQSSDITIDEGKVPKLILQNQGRKLTKATNLVEKSVNKNVQVMSNSKNNDTPRSTSSLSRKRKADKTIASTSENETMSKRFKEQPPERTTPAFPVRLSAANAFVPQDQKAAESTLKPSAEPAKISKTNSQLLQKPPISPPSLAKSSNQQQEIPKLRKLRVRIRRLKLPQEPTIVVSPTEAPGLSKVNPPDPVQEIVQPTSVQNPIETYSVQLDAAVDGSAVALAIESAAPPPVILPEVKPEDDLEVPTSSANVQKVAAQNSAPVESSSTNSQAERSTVSAEQLTSFGTPKVFSFLYPSRYKRSFDEIGLDFCCPNLDGPMRAIDPTRIHAKADIAILELPQFIVITTKIISKQDQNMPHKVRARIEQLAVKDNLTTQSKTTVAKSTTRAAEPQPTTTQSICSVEALSKKLPPGTVLKPKIMLAPNQPLKPLVLPPIVPNNMERKQLQTSLQNLDYLLQHLARRVTAMTITERQRTIEEMVRNSILLPIDVDVVIKLLDRYDKYVNVANPQSTQLKRLATVITPISKTPVAPATTASVSKVNPTVAPTTGSARLLAKRSAPSLAVSSSAPLTPKLTPDMLTRSKGPAMWPIYDKRNTIIGYRVAEGNTRTTPNVDPRLVHVRSSGTSTTTTTVSKSAAKATNTPVSSLKGVAASTSNQGTRTIITRRTVGKSDSPKPGSESTQIVKRKSMSAPIASPVVVAPVNVNSSARALPIAPLSRLTAAAPNNAHQNEECILPDSGGTMDSSSFDVEIKNEPEYGVDNEV